MLPRIIANLWALCSSSFRNPGYQSLLSSSSFPSHLWSLQCCSSHQSSHTNRIRAHGPWATGTRRHGFFATEFQGPLCSCAATVDLQPRYLRFIVLVPVPSNIFIKMIENYVWDHIFLYLKLNVYLWLAHLARSTNHSLLIYFSVEFPTE